MQGPSILNATTVDTICTISLPESRGEAEASGAPGPDPGSRGMRIEVSMIQYKEFQGRTLDDAIREACDYFGVPREKLEIEIVSDAKTGIFGLVGVKKASIRAGRVELVDAVGAFLGTSEAADPPEQERAGGSNRHSALHGAHQAAGGKKRRQPARRENSVRNSTSAERKKSDREDAASPRSPEKRQTARQSGREHAAETELKWPGHPDKDGKAVAGNADPASAGCKPLQDGSLDELPEYDPAACDQERLFAVVRDVVLRLVKSIVGEVPCIISVSASGVRVTLDCDDAAGLLVGKDGQTLAALQYLAARIISRQIGGAVRLQIDVGRYRERQDDTLKEQALSLAARVKETGRALSTRPLTAYQRRIVHLALEQDGAVQTHSKGEGTQRKVVISLKRENNKTDT